MHKKNACEKNHNENKKRQPCSERHGFCEKFHNRSEESEIIHNFLEICDFSHKDNTHSSAPTLRLNKAIAHAGYCSRRKADALILAGKVAINGKICANPATCVAHSDQITISGQPLQGAEPCAYVLMHKPVGVVSTVSDPQKRRTVLDLLPQNLRLLRLYPVGRLDYFSEGLLLLTNDGNLAHKLTHPRYHLPKRYQVLVRGEAPAAALRDFRAGMRLESGEQLLPVPTTATRLPDGNTLLELELRQGLNRQIRRMCEQAGLVVLRLKRTGEGPLELGDLAPGKIRELTAAEVAQLRSAVA